MRILLVSPVFPPQRGAGGQRTQGFAQAWRRAGEDVVVLTSAKRADAVDGAAGRDEFEVAEVAFRVPRYLEALRRIQKSEAPAHALNGTPRATAPGAPFWLAGLRRVQQHSGAFSAARMPDLTSHWIEPALAWARARAARAGAWDVVVSSFGPYCAHVAAMRIKAAGLARLWVADFRDLWTDNHLYRGLFPFTLVERGLERRCLASADLVTTVSEGLAATLRRKTAAPVEVIYNGHDDAATGCGECEQREAGSLRLVYTGTLYPRGQDPSPLLRAMASMRTARPESAQRLRLIVAGSGAERWRSLAARCGAADMIELRGIVSRGAALGLQHSADALILLDWDYASSGVLTAKVFEYLVAAAPILVIGGSVDSAAAALVQRAGRGEHLGHDEARIARALEALIDGTLRAPGSGAGGGLAGKPDREFIASLSRQRQSLRLLERLRALVDKPARPSACVSKPE
jgi:glycosyltransferase involved in cell wall biosynthesis